jgi:unsaturated rhamnogalacturonyl hydrolase
MKELNLTITSYLKDKVDFSDTAKGKVVALDYYYNHELKKDGQGKDVQFHYTWEDRENSGYFKLGSIIENLGASLYEIHSAPTYNELKNTSVYIIVDPDTPKETASPNYIADSSITEIAKWVEDGGVLVLMANDAGNCEFEYLNKLSEKFGVHFNEVSLNKVEGNKFDMGKLDKFPNHPIFKNVKQIYLNAKPILANDKNIIMAGADYGKGYVFTLGDPWIYNEYIDHRILPAEYDNYLVAKNLFEWLMSKSKVVKNML